MRKLIASVMVSLDGYIEGPGRDISWHTWNAEMDEYMSGFFRTVDTIILGRVAYELMAGYWPTPTAGSENPGITHKMNNLAKIVYSRTLARTEWNNARLGERDFAGEINRLKQEPGRDLVLFGGSSILASFMQENLVDEFRLFVNPVILGSGNPLFKNLNRPRNLELAETRPFRCGNVLLIYHPAEQTG